MWFAFSLLGTLGLITLAVMAAVVYGFVRTKIPPPQKGALVVWLVIDPDQGVSVMSYDQSDEANKELEEFLTKAGVL